MVGYITMHRSLSLGEGEGGGGKKRLCNSPSIPITLLFQNHLYEESISPGIFIYMP